MRRKLTAAGLGFLILSVIVPDPASAGSPSEEVPPFQDSEIQRRWRQDRKDYVLIGGVIYQERITGEFSPVIDYYDPDFLKDNYLFDGGGVFQTFDDRGVAARIRLSNSYSDDFESYMDFSELFVSRELVDGLARTDSRGRAYDFREFPTRWSSLTLQSPSAPTVERYVELRKSILENGGDFIDNRVDLSVERARSGTQCLRFHAVPPSRSMVTSKSSIATESVFFRKGDEFRFSGMFFFELGMPTTIMDLESTWLLGHSGIRILFAPDGTPYVELKAFDKPLLRSREFRVPRNRWVHIDIRIVLDDVSGRVQLRVDDEMVIDGTMPTLPLPDTVLNSVEIGISAASEETILYVDDIEVEQIGAP